MVGADPFLTVMHLLSKYRDNVSRRARIALRSRVAVRL